MLYDFEKQSDWVVFLEDHICIGKVYLINKGE